MLLHTVNKAPPAHAVLDSCLRAALPGACVLLIEDGVHAAIIGSPGLTAIESTEVRCFALHEDLQARGLLEHVSSAVEVIDYAGFVALCVECHAVQSWY